MNYVANLTYVATQDEVTTGHGTWTARPSDLTEFDNWMECASHFTTNQAAQRTDILSVSFDVDHQAVSFQLDSGIIETHTISPNPGELLAASEDTPEI